MMMVILTLYCVMQAMYQAKLEGKHRYHLFDPEHDQRTIEKHHQLDE